MKRSLSTSRLTAVWLLITVVGFATFSSCKKNDTGSSTPPASTVTDVVSTSSNFTILKAAIIKAGLAATLSGTGPFTVFAPDDAAFAASGITMNTVNALSSDQLKTILLYHTLTALVKSSDVPAGPNAPVATAGGDSVYVTHNSNGVFINGVPVVTADISASNGVIHNIARVLLPPVGNIVEAAQADTNFSYLVAAVLRASQGTTNVADVLSGTGPFHCIRADK